MCRYPERPLEPPEEKPRDCCDFCKYEIGEYYYEIDGERICEDCLEEYAKQYFAQYLRKA